jgi:hypothetical protein
MIKNKGLLIWAAICFLGINTSYFWEGSLGFLMFPMLFVFIISMPITVILWFRQLYLVIKEKFSDKRRIYSMLCVAILLGCIITQPYGIIDFEKMESKDVLLADREGVAGCQSYIKLKKDMSFYIKSICFGVSKVSGNYTLINDTIRFKTSTPDYFKFGIIKPDTTISQIKKRDILYLYRSAKDPHPLWMFITKNDLKK